MNARNDDRDRADWGADPELLVVLSSADPARSLPPLRGEDLERLVAATWCAASADAESGEARDLTGRRVPLWLLPLVVAAAAAVLIGALGVSRLGSDVTNDKPLAQSPLGTATATPPGALSGPTLLSIAPRKVSRCAVPTAEMLATQQIAFEGVVTGLADGSASLTPSTIYAGAVADQVVVSAPTAEMTTLLSAVQFEVGGTYLVSATDGQVTLCGYSAAADPTLRALYEQAFTG